MDEAEWLACEDPEALLLFLADTGASDRKARLFGCACVRRVWGDLADERLRQAALVAERFADGLATARQLEAARKKAARLCEGVGDIIADHGPMAVASLCERPAGWFIPAESTGAVAAEARSDEGASWGVAHKEEQRAQVGAIRDIFGNPFRPPRPRAFPAHVVGLAQECYDAFPELSERFPILADALDDLGEGQAAEHCRQDGHVKGCHVLDWVLGRE
jgi:hypothetical protein